MTLKEALVISQYELGERAYDPLLNKVLQWRRDNPEQFDILLIYAGIIPHGEQLVGNLGDIRRRIVISALSAARGNQKEAAGTLGISARKMNYVMKALKIRRPKADKDKEL